MEKGLKNVRDPFYGHVIRRVDLQRHMKNGNRIYVWKFKRCRVWHLAWSNNNTTVCGKAVVQDCASCYQVDWPNFRMEDNKLCPRCNRIYEETYKYVISMYKEVLREQWAARNSEWKTIQSGGYKLPHG